MNLFPTFTPKAPAGTPENARSGSALLLTLLVVSLLLVITLSFTVFVRLELKTQISNQQHREAQLIAKLALDLAINQLQESAGPDQRSTATAAMGDGATAVTAASSAVNGLGTTGNGSRYWTGVWGNLNAPESLFTESPEPVLLTWLISGNTPAFSFADNGQITFPQTAPTLSFTPGLNVQETAGSPLTAATTAATPLTIGSQPAALLLGPASTGLDLSSYVVAPMEELSQHSERKGRLAWWVGDEGVKAKFNLVDPYIENDSPDDQASTGGRDSRYRILTSQRNGIERMTDFGDPLYPVATTPLSSPLYKAVEKTLTYPQIALTASGISATTLHSHIHGLSPYSQGVLADSQFGGLRQDLSFHLDPQSADTFLDGSNILPDTDIPVSDFSGSKFPAQASPFSRPTAEGGLGYTTLEVSPRLGPKWDQIKSFYRLGLEQPLTVAVQPAIDIDSDPIVVQAGISPVIVQVRTLFALRAGPELQTSLILIIGNPYTRTLTAPEGLDFRFSLLPQTVVSSGHKGTEAGIVCDYQPPPPLTAADAVYLFTRGEGMDLAINKSLRYYPLLKYSESYGPTDPDAGHPGALDWVLFRIPAGELNLAPGEARAFKIDTSSPYSESYDGSTYTVVPLQELTSTAPLTYYNHSLDPHYISTDPIIPAGVFTGDPIDPNALFHYGIIGGGGSCYTLSVGGKPHSVLQRISSARIFSSLVKNDGAGLKYQGVFTDYGPDNDLFPTSFDGKEIGGIQTFREFLNGSRGDARYSGETTRAIHAEANLLGSYQKLRGLADPEDSGSSNLKSLAPFSFHGNPYFDETNLHANLNTDSSLQYVWGASSNPAKGTAFVIADLPSAPQADEVPILSLAQLTHLDLTADDLALGTNEQSGMGVGNSHYDRFVPRDASNTDWIENYWSKILSDQSDNSSTAMGAIPTWYKGYVPDIPKDQPIRRYDNSYLLNTALWDRYFFSTLRPSAGSNTTPADNPANRRLIYRPGSTPTLGQLRASNVSDLIPDLSLLGPGENGRVPASHLLINGAFNINSTSVEAWKAVLSGLRGLGISSSPADAGLTPMPRSIRQPGGVQSIISTTDAQEFPETFNGFRALNDEQIDNLAEQIVLQIRARGPFLSLAQFVNRNLTPAGNFGDPVADTGLAGAIQQAIDHTDINAELNKDASLEQAAEKHNQLYPDNAYMPTGDLSGLSHNMAAPGWLNQADVLQAIAPALAARSDTFVIRTYGEVLPPGSTGNNPDVLARAWVEAVVQRIPDYMDDSERPTLFPSQTNGINRKFGRRFRILSFRWLSSDEI